MRAILEFCGGAPVREFAEGEVLLAEGDETGALWVLVSGQVEVCKGDVHISVTGEPGSVFGEISALLDIPHTATVRTLTAGRAHLVANARSFLAGHPEMAALISTLLAQRLNAVTTYLADLKAQFENQKDHLAMVDEVLATLMHQQAEEFVPGSDRCPDTRI